MSLVKFLILFSILFAITSCKTEETKSSKTVSDTTKIQQKIEQNGDSINHIEDTVKYDKVIAYEFEGHGDNDIVTDGVLIEKSKIYQEKEITLEKVKKFESIIQSKVAYGGITAFCFDPHFGIVYYKKDKIVDYVSVCLECNRLYASYKIPSQLIHKSSLCDECYDEGLSKVARKQISQYIKELGLGHWELAGGIFDE